jgi:hypothetical protein
MRGNCVSNVDNSSGTVEKVLEMVDTLGETVDMLSKTVDKAGGSCLPRAKHVQTFFKFRRISEKYSQLGLT